MEKHIQLYVIVLGLLGAILGSIFYLTIVIAAGNSIARALLDHWPIITGGVIAAISLGGTIVFAFHDRAKKLGTEHDVFISIPMTGLDSEEKYNEMHREAVEIGRVFTQEPKINNIYCAAITYKTLDQIQNALVAGDLEHLKKSKRFILIYPEKLVTSCLVEAGYAISLGVPCIFFVRNEDHLPYILKEIGQKAANVITFEYGDEDLSDFIVRQGVLLG